MQIEPFGIGVCSWSLRPRSVADLKSMLAHIGTDIVQLACGDPEHGTWAEGDDFPRVARESGLRITGAMIGFPGEDYTTPATIRQTGGFGPPTRRAERLALVRWALERTRALGVSDLSLHAGFIPPVGDPGRRSFLETLARVSALAGEYGVTIAFETGQEEAALLRTTLDELASPALRVNFDPANMLLYAKGDPIEAVRMLAPYLRSVHAKDAIRPDTPGTWGREVPLGKGEVDIPRFLSTLKGVGFAGPICVEREAGADRMADIAHGVRYLRECLARG